MVSLYTMTDKRITWFSIGPEETVNDDPRLEAAETPNLFIFTVHRLGSEKLGVDGGHETVDGWAVRKGGRSITVLLTNHALPRHPIATQRVHVTLTHAPPVSSAFVERIDGAHANAKRAWQEMGEPEYPKGPEVERMQEASRMHKEPQSWKYAERTVHLEVELPPHAVAAVTLEFGEGEGRGTPR